MRIYDRNNKRIVLDGITREFLGSLQELRIMHGFSYRHVGEAIGKIERTVCDYMHGVSNPRIKPLMNLAEFFGADLSGSINYQYWHGQIDFAELRRELSENDLTHQRLSSHIPYEPHIICCSVNDYWKGSLQCLSAVIEILDRARNGEIPPRIVKRHKEQREYKLSCPDEITLEFLRSLKSRRKSMGLTIKQLACMIGVSRVMLVRYESCQNLPTVEILMRLVKIFGYDLSESINGQFASRKIPYEKIKRGLSDYGLSRRETARITNYDKSTISLALRKSVGGSLKVLSDVIGVIDHEREAYRLAHEIAPVKRKRRNAHNDTDRTP